MNQINDTIHATLEKEGFAGSLDDKLSTWLKVETGQIDGQIMDLWSDFFDVKTIPAGNHSDRMAIFYRTEGAVGDAYNNLALDYWQKRLALP